MKTTLDLPEDLYRRVKAKAAMGGETVTKVVVRALEREVPQAPAVSQNRVQVPLLSIGGPTIHLTNADIESILTDEFLKRP